MEVKTTQLRLIDIITLDNGVPEDLVGCTNDVQKELYKMVIYSHYTSFILAYSKEEFKYWLKFYWDKNIGKYESVFNRATEMYDKLYSFRDGSSNIKKDETTVRKTSKTETFSPGETTTHTYDHTMKLSYTADEAENFNKEKRFEQNAIENSTNAKTDTVYKYGAEGDKGDTLTRSGSNKTVTEYTGDPDKFITDNTTTDKFSDYDPDRFIKALRSANVLDCFIDEFDNLFEGVLYYD